MGRTILAVVDKGDGVLPELLRSLASRLEVTRERKCHEHPLV